MSWSAATCRANGIDIHYLRTGGNRPTVVLLHGLGGSGACWTLLARALEADFDVVMPDARGHGQSGTPPRGYQYSDHAADVAALIVALDLSAPALIGHSMGGLTAAMVASQREAGIRSVVLADPTFLSPERQREVHGSDVVEQHRRLLQSDRRQVLAQALSRAPHRPPELVEIITDARLQTRTVAFDVLIPPNPDYRELVAAISVPVLLVCGDKGIVSAEAAGELQQFNPQLQHETIPDAGHGLPYDQPDALARAVRSFLGAR